MTEGEEPLLSSEKKSVFEIVESVQKRIRALFAQANQAKIRSNECANLAAMNINDLVLAKHHMKEKHMYLRIQEQNLNEISNLNALVYTLNTASRNLELQKELSSASVTLDDILKSMPKDAEYIMEKIREQTQDVQYQNKMLSPEEIEESAIEDEIELLLRQQLPTVPQALENKGKDEDKDMYIKNEPRKVILF